MSGAPEQSPRVGPSNPWPGLSSFTANEARYFFGRDVELEELLRRVARMPLTVLFGQSGLGKTSLVQAGLFPALREEGRFPVPILIDFSDAADPPGEQIAAALGAALDSHRIGGTGHPDEAPSVWEFLHDRDTSLRFPDGTPAQPVFVFDQFEELFTLGGRQTQPGDFLRAWVDELGGLIENQAPEGLRKRIAANPSLVAEYDFERQDFRVLVSLREDYLAYLQGLRARIPSIFSNNMRLTPMNGAQALDAVFRPGEALLDRGVAEEIVRFLASRRQEGGDDPAARLVTTSEQARIAGAAITDLEVDPSLLSLFCEQLNKSRQERGLSRITADLYSGRREAILTDFYARATRDLDPRVRAYVEDKLLTPEGFREDVAIQVASYWLRQSGLPANSFDMLVERRLLHYVDRGRSTRVELTHDVLRDVVMASRVTRHQQEAIERAQAEKAEAEAKLARARRQRKVTLLFTAGTLLVAAVAVYQTFRAVRGQTDLRTTNSALAEQTAAAKAAKIRAEAEAARADSLRIISERANQGLKAQTARSDSQAARAVRSEAKEATAHRAADVAVARANDRLLNMCKYSKQLAKELSDSSFSGSSAENVYAGMIQISDSFAQIMRKDDPTATCPLQLQARFEAIGARQLYNQSLNQGLTEAKRKTMVAKALEHAYDGVRALEELDRHADPESRDIAAFAHLELVSLLPLLTGADSGNRLDIRGTTERLARKGQSVLDSLDPSLDSLTDYRRVRMHLLRENAFLRSGRQDSARATLVRALNVIREGRRRGGQNPEYMYYAEGEIEWRHMVLDSMENHPADAVADARQLLRAAIGQLDMKPTSSFNQEYLGMSWERLGNQLWRSGNRAEARAAYDSSEVNRSRLAGRYALTASGGETARRNLQELRGRLIEKELAAGDDVPRAVIVSRRLVAAAELIATPPEAPASQRVRLAEAYTTFGRAMAANGDYASYITYQRRHIAIDSALMEGSRHHPDTVALLARAYEAAAVVADSAKHPADAVLFETLAAGRYRERIDTLRRRRLSQTVELTTLANAYGNLSWYHLFNREPALAVDRAKDGIRADSTRTFIYTNLISGFLLSGQIDSARVWFTKMRNLKYGDPAHRFGDQVITDLGDLLAAKVATQADIDRVRSWDRP